MTKACPYGVNTERPCLANGIVRELSKHCRPLLPYDMLVQVSSTVNNLLTLDKVLKQFSTKLTFFAYDERNGFSEITPYFRSRFQ